MVSAYRPESFEEALRIRQERRVIPFAGGTDLMVKHKRHTGLTPQFDYPALFLGHLQEQRYVSIEGDMLVIGATATLADLEKNSEVPEALKRTIAEIASPALRNIATLTGNICNASPAGDTLPALYCLNASLVLARHGGERQVNIDEFILGPARTDLREDELVKSIILPRESFDWIHYRKVGTRQANALSKLSFLGLVNIKGEIIQDLRLAFGAVAPTVIRARNLEREFAGCSTHDLAQRRAELLDVYAELIVPIDDQRSTAHYRKAVALRLLDHFLTATTCQGN